MEFHDIRRILRADVICGKGDGGPSSSSRPGWVSADEVREVHLAVFDTPESPHQCCMSKEAERRCKIRSSGPKNRLETDCRPPTSSIEQRAPPSAQDASQEACRR